MPLGPLHTMRAHPTVMGLSKSFHRSYGKSAGIIVEVTHQMHFS
jgi:hypothetical protein